MAKSSKSAQQKAARKRKQREQRVRKEKSSRLSREQGQGARRRLLQAAEFPVVDCVISKGWRERGLAHILIARDGGEDVWYVGGYYLDTFCLGLKDAAAVPGAQPEEYEGNIKQNIFNDPVEFEAADAGEVRFLVEECIAFAERLGFLPNRRWEEAKLLLRGIEKKPFAVEFGREGQPCLVLRQGENLQGAVRKLERRLEAGEYQIVEETGDG